MLQTQGTVNTESLSLLTLEREIGSGKFRVFQARGPSGKKYAVKAYPRDSEAALRCNHERMILNSLTHQNIIQSGPQFLVQTNLELNSDLLITEFASHGNFYELIMQKAFTNEKLIRTFFHQLIAGVEYIHLRGFAHLDIKLENLLLGDDLRLKIIDFDQSQPLTDPCMKFKGTAFYRPNEVIKSKCKNFEAADVYASGVVLFAMKHGEFPFSETSDERGVHIDHVEEFICDNKAFWNKKLGTRKNRNFFSESFKTLINGMLAPGERRRFSIKDIKESQWYNEPVYEEKELEEEIEKILERIMFMNALRKRVQII